MDRQKRSWSKPTSHCVASNRDGPRRCPLRRFVSCSTFACPRTEKAFRSHVFVRCGSAQKFPLTRSRRAQRPSRRVARPSTKKNHVPTFAPSASTGKNIPQGSSWARREPDLDKG